MKKSELKNIIKKILKEQIGPSPIGQTGTPVNNISPIGPIGPNISPVGQTTTGTSTTCSEQESVVCQAAATINDNINGFGGKGSGFGDAKNIFHRFWHAIKHGCGQCDIEHGTGLYGAPGAYDE